VSTRAGTHLFGSVEGYTTLAHSSDVTTSEISELAVLGFGQTSDERFLASLTTTPSVYGRPLNSGRFAVTRCFPGSPDDAGRTTLRLHTLLLEAAAYDKLCSDGLEHLVRSDVWTQAAFDNGETVNLPANSRAATRHVDEYDFRVYDALVSAVAHSGSISVLPDTLEVERAILRFPQVLDADQRRSYRWGVRLLATAVPVDLCTLASQASRSGRRRVNTMSWNGSWRNEGVAFLADSNRANGLEQLPPPQSVLQRDFGASTPKSTMAVEPTGMTADSAQPKRWSPLVISLAGAFACTVLIIVISIGLRPIADEPTPRPPDSIVRGLGEIEAALATIEQALPDVEQSPSERLKQLIDDHRYRNLLPSRFDDINGQLHELIQHPHLDPSERQFLNDSTARLESLRMQAIELASLLARLHLNLAQLHLHSKTKAVVPVGQQWGFTLPTAALFDGSLFKPLLEEPRPWLNAWGREVGDIKQFMEEAAGVVTLVLQISQEPPEPETTVAQREPAADPDPFEPPTVHTPENDTTVEHHDDVAPSRRGIVDEFSELDEPEVEAEDGLSVEVRQKVEMAEPADPVEAAREKLSSGLSTEYTFDFETELREFYDVCRTLFDRFRRLESDIPVERERGNPWVHLDRELRGLKKDISSGCESLHAATDNYIKWLDTEISTKRLGSTQWEDMSYEEIEQQLIYVRQAISAATTCREVLQFLQKTLIKPIYTPRLRDTNLRSLRAIESEQRRISRSMRDMSESLSKHLEQLRITDDQPDT